MSLKNCTACTFLYFLYIKILEFAKLLFLIRAKLRTYNTQQNVSEKEKNKKTKSICCDCLTDTTPANSVLAFRSIN